MKQNQFEFKPFDKVLVRDADNLTWHATFYSHFSTGLVHATVCGCWNQCIPYNEETKHLVGTSEPYIAPEPVKWDLVMKGRQSIGLTQTEFENFIKEVITNSTDVTTFKVTYRNN